MWTEERLNKMLTTPSEALSCGAGKVGGRHPGAGRGRKNGADAVRSGKERAAGRRAWKAEVIAVSRFSDPLVVELLWENGVEVY